MNFKRIAMLAVAVMMASAMLLTGCTTAAPTAAPTTAATVAPTDAATVAPTDAPTTAPTDAPTASPEPTTAPLSGKLALSGSTSVQPLAENLAKAFMAANTGVQVDIQGGGSSVGVSDATSGLSDIGMVSRALKDEEKATLKETIICIDGVDVVVNTANGVSDLTAQQITDIYTGKITNWKDVGGSDEPIIVIQRESASGTRDAFQGFFKLVETDAAGNKKELVTEKALEFNSTGAVITAVAGKPGAIGYASMGSVDSTVKALKIGGVEATQANVVNKTYTYQRPFVLATKGAPAGLAEAFISWIFGPDGQALIAKSYITVARQ
jgi:phosphate transport system substrate-binding protein